MPRITPGITSGASIASDSAALPRKVARSSRNALTVPTATASSVTQPATTTLVQIDDSSARSAKRPMRPRAASPRNQSSVNAPPRRRRIVGVVEREHCDDRERQEQEHEERRHISGDGVALEPAARQRGDHERRITSAKRCPVSFRPSQTIAVESASSRNPNAAPCSQLKRVMNCV